jgi:cytochrome c-type biogenesis protein CcmH/NrfF
MLTLRRILSAAITISFAVALLGASGDTSRFDDLGRHRIICVCGCNQMLLECNHVGCTYSDKMRNELAAAVEKQSDDDVVLQSFVHEYGVTVLAAPTSHGFDKVAWIMPFAVFFAGTFAVALVIKNWRGSKPLIGGPPVSPAFDKYREQARRETDI